MSGKPDDQRLRLILGDQLNSEHSWFSRQDPQTLYLIAELHQETAYVRHHVQKVSAFFKAMANFADDLENAGHKVLFLTLDDTQEFSSLNALIQHYVDHLNIRCFEYQRPDEYRLLRQLQALELPDSCSVSCCDSEHFMLDYEDLNKHVTAGKHRRMESFYRNLRRKFKVLMAGDDPEGGQWNFDQDNRHKLKQSDIAELPSPLVFSNDVSDILSRLRKHEVDTFGTAEDELIWPCDKTQALELLHHFCDTCLPAFGRFQDAMTSKSKHAWSLYHSRLAFALNTKMLSPHIVIDTAIDRYRADGGKTISIAQIEGFIRQILGWREYVRAIYWVNMSEYRKKNALGAERPLPGFYWNADTKMHCMQQAIRQSLDYAYAHHIQRLMVTGNFALLAGIHPDQVDDWYLGIYIDAIEWVEMPNTRGMSLYADGGLIASKPYAASANYLNKMSDYCRSCKAAYG